MNPEIKERWVAALRSGDYTQTRGALHRVEDYTDTAGEFYPAGMCCLGVLCDLYIKAEVGPERWHTDPDRRHRAGFGLSGTSNRIGLPTHSVVEWAGLSPSFDLTPEDEESELVLPHLNDGGKTFDQIADLIERYL